MRKLLLVLCILLLSTSVHSQKAHPSRTGESVVKTIQELCKAFETADTARLRKNMTADFSLTGSDGSVTTLEDEINDLKSGKARYRVFENVDMQPRLYGNNCRRDRANHHKRRIRQNPHRNGVPIYRHANMEKRPVVDGRQPCISFETVIPLSAEWSSNGLLIIL
ncbi:MAG: nuclear transport factor 2 family protein [Saprospiraceae bacterium]|nr:nuclear transport factor 2 family protein [Pyrinomonadaceae bacterium]